MKNDLIKLVKQADKVANVLKNISHPTRLKILCFLVEKERNVGELVQLCKVAQPIVSQYLIKMKEDKILKAAKQGQFVTYALKDEKLAELVLSLKKVYCE
jgi:DNA-binding transcriptional ArsR family regulator